MSSMYTCYGCSSIIVKNNKNNNNNKLFLSTQPRKTTRVPTVVRASTLDSSSSSNFAKRIETAWLISQQPMPVACTVCVSNGHVECKWCRGTGFFILGDNMLCQVATHDTSCVICSGKGSVRCVDCKGTGFRAKWLEEPPISKQ